MLNLPKDFSKFMTVFAVLSIFVAGCDVIFPTTQLFDEVDIEGTIASGIAATQEALAESQFEASQVGSPPESPDSDSEPVLTPTISATRVDMNPPLQLPFTDNFDQGLRSEWRVINGRPLVSEGRLTSAVDELSIEIGNSTLTDYTLQLDVGGKTSCSHGYGDYLTITFSPTLRFSYHYIDFGGRLIWSTYDSKDWTEISRQDHLDCGRFEIKVSGNKYQLLINGSLASDLVFEPAQGPLLMSIDEHVFIDNLEVR